MKVLVLSESSQASRYWEGALPLLKKNGIDASFATTREEGILHRRLEALHIETFAFGARSAKDYPGIAYELGRFLKQHAIDVVHASEPIQASIAGLACLYARNTGCIFHYHHTKVTGMQKALSRLGSWLSDRVMVVSEASRDATVRWDGTPINNTFLAYNGIAPLPAVSENQIENLKNELKISHSAKVVTIVARLRPVKGHKTLFEACEIVAKNISEPLHLVVVGDGEERERLMRAARDANGFMIHFVGHQENVELWYSLADVVAVPSYFEPFGLVIVEAMACGKPVVASDHEGPGEIIEAWTSGVLTRPRDPDSLASALIKVLGSPDLARRLGEQGRSRVEEKFTLDRMVEAWIVCYRSVVT